MVLPCVSGTTSIETLFLLHGVDAFQLWEGPRSHFPAYAGVDENASVGAVLSAPHSTGSFKGSLLT